MPQFFNQITYKVIFGVYTYVFQPVEFILVYYEYRGSIQFA